MVHVNNLKQHDGIICDLCGIVLLKQFNYFSLNFTQVCVDVQKGTSGVKSLDDKYLNLDVCEGCQNRLKMQVLDVINKREKKGSWSTDVSIRPN